MKLSGYFHDRKYHAFVYSKKFYFINSLFPCLSLSISSAGTSEAFLSAP